MHDAAGEILETRVPARLDRLPWGRFHTLVVAALEITWVLDGLEVTLICTISAPLVEGEGRVTETLPSLTRSRTSQTPRGVTIAQIAIAWVFSRGDDIRSLIGARWPDMLAEPSWHVICSVSGQQKS